MCSRLFTPNTKQLIWICVVRHKLRQIHINLCEHLGSSYQSRFSRYHWQSQIEHTLIATDSVSLRFKLTSLLKEKEKKESAKRKWEKSDDFLVSFEIL